MKRLLILLAVIVAIATAFTSCEYFPISPDDDDVIEDDGKKDNETTDDGTTDDNTTDDGITDGDDNTAEPRYTVTAEEFELYKNLANYTYEATQEAVTVENDVETVYASQRIIYKMSESAGYMYQYQLSGANEYSVEIYLHIKDGQAYQIHSVGENSWDVSKTSGSIPPLGNISVVSMPTYDMLTYNETEKAYTFTQDYDTGSVTYRFAFLNGNLVNIEALATSTQTTGFTRVKITVDDIGTSVVDVPEYSYSPMKFTSNGDGTCSFSKYDDSESNVVIPATSPSGDVVTSIGASAFYNCKNLTSVTIPDTVTTIGSSAFAYCTSLTGIIIPNGVTQIDGSAFVACTSLTDITIPNGVTEIASGTFSGCESLVRVTIPDTVTTIGSSAFYSCTSLTSIIIPSSVTEIGTMAFYDCKNLAVVYNLSSLEITAVSSSNGYVGYYAVAIVDSLDHQVKVWTDNNGYTFYENGDDCYLVSYKGTEKELTLPASCNGKNYKIYKKAFYDSDITGVVMPSTVTAIGENAFESCQNLTSIVIPDSVTDIGKSAFYSCERLISVVIGKNVSSIGDDAFYDCEKLFVVYNLSSLDITSGSYDNGYVGRYALEILTSLDEKSSVWTDEDGYVFYESGSTCYLIYYTGTDTELVLPSSCKGKNYEIYEEAFRDCTGITSVVIPAGVTKIGDDAFAWCYSLKSVIIGDNVTDIGFYAFWGCYSLVSIVVGKNVSVIEYCAFMSCDSLTDVYYRGSEADWKNISIYGENEYLTNANISYNYNA